MSQIVAGGIPAMLLRLCPKCGEKHHQDYAHCDGLRIKRAVAGQHRTPAHNRRKAGATPAPATKPFDLEKVNLRVGVWIAFDEEQAERRLRQAIGRS